MKKHEKSEASDAFESSIRLLAEFRYTLREFLHFSEEAATRVGLRPQQHQLLLQVAGAPRTEAVTIAYIAERLRLRHHSVAELVTRSEREGLLVRTVDTVDRRRAVLRVTQKGKLLLGRLAGAHARELKEMAPRLAKALQRVETFTQTSADSKAR